MLSPSTLAQCLLSRYRVHGKDQWLLLNTLFFVIQGCPTEQVLKRLDQDGLKDAAKQGLVYFEREERDLHMLLIPEVLDQVRSTYPGESRRERYVYIDPDSTFIPQVNQV